MSRQSAAADVDDCIERGKFVGWNAFRAKQVKFCRRRQRRQATESAIFESTGQEERIGCLPEGGIVETACVSDGAGDLIAENSGR